MFPNKTVRENVSFALEVIEADPRKRERANSVLDLVGLFHKAEVFPPSFRRGAATVSLAGDR